MARRLTTGQPDIVWRAPLFDVTGYANDAREFVLGLADAGTECRLSRFTGRCPPARSTSTRSAASSS